ncbi:MAG: DegT/DnrJ/EryC1/StrS family aminotransferase [Bacteroidota bacterium]|nr:DegT/DnrJ/EryC1/StrS family aminotransferase [Bacteroidota bacterium]
MIHVTKPFLPPKAEYQAYIDSIWQRNWLTNDGPLVNELELQLKDHLKLRHLLFLGNGTIALQIAIKALELKGEIITTPFSYVATVSSIVWEDCEPVFVDIDSKTMNIDPFLIEAAITKKTSAILATHVYGNPCDIEGIDKIAKKHKLKVIYDAAHCFGTKYKGKSVLEYGDISTISFHATKLFHTIEGGAVVTKDKTLLKKMSHLRNFGHNGPDKYYGCGINGKNSEFHAAMGLVNLSYADKILIKRKNDHQIYDRWLDQLKLQKPVVMKNSEFNFSYYPIVFNSEQDCINVFNDLKNKEIFARRYFFPVLSSLDYVKKKKMPVAEVLSKKVLCLPLYFDIEKTEIELICRLILRRLKN